MKRVCLSLSFTTWPVSTIGSVSDYDYIGNQEVAGSSPVLVIFLHPAAISVHYAIALFSWNWAIKLGPIYAESFFFNLADTIMYSYVSVRIGRARGTH